MRVPHPMPIRQQRERDDGNGAIRSFVHSDRSSAEWRKMNGLTASQQPSITSMTRAHITHFLQLLVRQTASQGSPVTQLFILSQAGCMEMLDIVYGLGTACMGPARSSTIFESYPRCVIPTHAVDTSAGRRRSRTKIEPSDRSRVTPECGPQ
jgi:hypothetical protein